MRILKTVQAYYPFQARGGPVLKVRAIARGLVQRGHNVRILTADLGLNASQWPEMKAEKCRWGWRAQEQGIESIFLKSRGHYRALTFNPGAITFSFSSLTNVDVVHVYGLYDLLGPAVTFFCRRNHIPYVVEPMGMFRPIVSNLRLKKLYHTLFGARMLHDAKRVIATSAQEKLELENGAIAPDRIAIRRNGIDVPSRLPPAGSFRERWRIAPGAKVVLFLGRLVPKKSPDILIDAFALWRHERRDAASSVLVLAGPEEDAGYSEHLRSLAKASGVGNSAVFTGPLYDDDKWAAYRDADVFVLPSQNENFGNSAAEALACNTPAIITDQCGIAPIIDGRAGLVVRHDTQAVAEALRMILEDDSLASRFRNACPFVVSGLTWEEPLTQMEEIYRDAGSQERKGLYASQQAPS